MQRRTTPTGDAVITEAQLAELARLRARYAAERDQRVRSEGREQYVRTDGDFRYFSQDIHADPHFQRAASACELDVVVVGGGFAGLSVCARLRNAGIDAFLILEKGADFGGTWYWNRYPGLRCDTEAYVYLPLLEETGYIPTQKYASGSEIFQHAQRIGRHFDLYSKARFQTQVRQMRWDDGRSRWIVTTDRGDRIEARFVVQTVGVLDSPKLPGIAGIGTFKGRMFHTSRWDYAYTGGTLDGGLSRLADKRVAVIGTGCTAIQVIPHLAQDAKHLYVFQRTPSVVDVRDNAPTDPEWTKTLTPGWHKRRRENFVAWTSGLYRPEDLVSDSWTHTNRRIGLLSADEASASGRSPEKRALQMELADAGKMDEIRSRVDGLVRDRQTADGLKPWYRYFCKRPTFSDEFLQTFNRSNVTLVSTNGAGVESMTETAVVFAGVSYEVDCVIFATGFESGTALSRRTGCEIYGRSGRTLTQKWSHGYATLFGLSSHDFPNLFFTGVNQNGVSVVFTYCLDEQAEHIVDLIGLAKARKWIQMEPTEEAERNWVATIRRLSEPTRKFLKECTPGYLNNEGSDAPGGSIDEAYGGGPLEFYSMLREWRSGTLDGMRIVVDA